MVESSAEASTLVGVGVLGQCWGIGRVGVVQASLERGTHLATYQEQCFTGDK